jgi:segregation and condensation protein B
MEAQTQTEPAPRASALLQQQLCEAALYVSGRPLDFKTIGSVIGARSEDKIRSIARAIAERYAKMDSPVQVLELPDGRFVMQLRPEFVKNVRKLSNRPLLTPGPLRTLSFIALRQPISQSHVVRVRGKLAYQHVKQLKEMDLITYEKLGRSRVLRTTITFADYFNLNHDLVLMKKELKNVLDLTNQPPTQKEQDSGTAEQSGS